LSTPSRTILVVDDDASIRLLCRVNLELEGWSVREAGSVAHARAELADGTVDVALLDARLGDDDGVALLEEIRREYPRTKVAMLTGSAGTHALDGAAPDGVIGKPFGLDELTGTVRALAG
jgi:DNA-binding NtrC family response regulator